MSAPVSMLGADGADHADCADRAAGAAGAVRRRLAVPGAVREIPWYVLLAGLILLLIAAAALWPGLFTGTSPDEVNPLAALQGPSAHHLFGTDQLGRDEFSRVVHGTGTSVGTGVAATALALAAGSVAGVFAATAGRVADEAVMRVCDVLMSFPGLLLALLVVAILGPGTVNAAVAIGVSMTPGYTKLVRGQALVVRRSDYVRAAVTFGRRRTEIDLRHVAPNALAPLLVLATVTVGGAVVAGASLSFLGLGPQPPAPDWGAMLADGQNYLAASWAVAVFPGLAVTTTVVAVTVVGGYLRKRFEGGQTNGGY
ncbi:peptide/nickel transport system permease protein [Catenulispora sp. MAP5-51]|uniref:ABC transporter permease n=1 Tax=Catenulispora sp. MAP5-51 TaxID=3156298 RepID=UPI003512A63A